MRRFVDLHTHSTASDGTASPKELVHLADREKLAAVALTDHDTTDGLAAARAAAEALPELHLVGGIELSVKFHLGAMHILGLGIDERSSELAETLASLRAGRSERNDKMLARLQQLGLDISMADVQAVAQQRRGGQPGEIISRLHIAEALRRKGLVATTDEAFDTYIARGRPGYVARDGLTPCQAAETIHQADGIAALAHPVHLHCQNRSQLDGVLRDLRASGIEAIEVYHPQHNSDQTRLYLEFARRLGLLAVGGSDFHGSAKPQVELGHPRVPVSLISASRFAERLLGTSPR